MHHPTTHHSLLTIKNRDLPTTICYNSSMRSEELKQYIRDRSALFWYSPADKGETVSDELLVEHILNYGTMDDVRELFRLMGLQRVAEVFRSMTDRKRLNFFPEIWNFFDLLFVRHAC